MYALALFGLSAIMFGVIASLSHGDTWLHRLAIPEIVGGIGLLHSRTARAGAIVVGVVYAIFSVAAIPGIVAAPSSFERYGSFFEQFCVVCGSIAAYALTEANKVRVDALALTARLGIGLSAASFAAGQAVYFRYTASLVPVWIPPNQSFWTILTTIAFAMAAIALLANFQAGLALRLMSLMLVLFGALVWVPHIVAQPAKLFNWSEFSETWLIAATAWTMAVLAARIREARQRA